MANTPDYSWPPMDARKIMGKPYKRLDGPQKAAGRAKYTSDLKMKDMLYGAYLTCPHGHARITSIDTGAVEKMNGVKAVLVIAEAGKELQWHGQEVAAVAATAATSWPCHWSSLPASAMTRTALTPFIFSAALVSIEVTRA